MSDTAAVLEDLAKHLDAKAEVKRLNPADPSAAQAYENAAALLRRRALSQLDAKGRPL